jgi:hypothetical protein
MMPTTEPQPDPTIINLDEYEVSWAESVGLYRFSESERDGKHKVTAAELQMAFAIISKELLRNWH